MNIPLKYEDVVAKLDAALGREAALREELSKLADDYCEKADDILDLQQRLTVADQRAGVMEKALMRIARPHDCGCLPCTGDCMSKLSLEITVDYMRDTAEAALKPAAEDDSDLQKIGFVRMNTKTDQSRISLADMQARYEDKP